jgi:hypothetical protein
VKACLISYFLSYLDGAFHGFSTTAGVVVGASFASSFFSSFCLVYTKVAFLVELVLLDAARDTF